MTTNSSTCSTIVPSGACNTETPDSIDEVFEKEQQGSCAVHWLVTLAYSPDRSNSSNSFTPTSVNGEMIREWIEEHCKAAVWQLEQGEQGGDQGYLHWQIALALKKKNRFTWLKRHFNGWAHLQRAEKIEAVNRYCMKARTAIEGPFYHPRPIVGVTDYFEVRGHTYKWWQQEIVDLHRTEPDGRFIHWYWEPDGKAGKSVFMRHMILRYNVFPLGSASTKDMAYAFRKMQPEQKMIMINLPRTLEGHVNFTAIEGLLDGMVFSSKYESNFVMRNYTHLVFFANWKPDENKVSPDRWIIKDIRGNLLGGGDDDTTPRWAAERGVTNASYDAATSHGSENNTI